MGTIWIVDSTRIEVWSEDHFDYAKPSTGGGVAVYARHTGGFNTIHADGHVKFSLPGDTPKVGLDLGSGMQELSPQLHTVSIRPDDAELDLIWRGAQAYEGYAGLSKVTRLDAEVQ